MNRESPSRGSLRFSADGEDVGSLGVEGTVVSGVIDLHSQIWHRDGTNLTSIELRLWMPAPESDHPYPTDIAVVSPLQGDSSPPPALHLRSANSRPGTVVEITDLDDLKDETINVDFIVRPWSRDATTLAIDGTIELASGKLLGDEYTLEGRLELEFPELANQ